MLRALAVVALAMLTGVTACGNSDSGERARPSTTAESSTTEPTSSTDPQAEAAYETYGAAARRWTDFQAVAVANPIQGREQALESLGSYSQAASDFQRDINAIAFPADAEEDVAALTDLLAQLVGLTAAPPPEDPSQYLQEFGTLLGRIDNARLALARTMFRLAFGTDPPPTPATP